VTAWSRARVRPGNHVTAQQSAVARAVWRVTSLLISVSVIFVLKIVSPPALMW
jgi:hypothetical protein